ncbi:MAG TPA: serine hydrolase domain-containing protein [Symbiobacteriaceae bacterium]|nr:serine hydrolase domain-containing protein [Symbiobacteriaceae bacterium]
MPVAAAALSRIEAYFTQELRKARIPGGAVAVVAGGETLLAKGIGQTARSGGEAITADTLFEIGSLTKGWTAMAILQLRDRGLLDLSAPVQQYLPWFRVADREASARITVEHLLDQTSGLPNGAWKVGMDRPALRTAVERLATVKLISPPGQQWMYSNMNYSTLGLIIETVTGQPYATYIQEQILGPLGMSASTLTPLNRQQRPWARPYVQQIGGMTQYAITDDAWAAPAGLGPACTITDLARWAAAHLGAGAGVVLAERSLAESHAGTADCSSQIKGGYYGRGWFTMTWQGRRLVLNHGGTAGYSSVCCFLPDEGLAVVGLLNCNAGIAMKLGLNMLRILTNEAPDVPDVFPDFGAFFAGLIRGLAIGGALLLGSLTLGLIVGWNVPAWLGWALAVVAALFLALPWSLKKNMMIPLPMPMNVGPGGWPLNLILAWWPFVLGLAGWAVFGILG